MGGSNGARVGQGRYIKFVIEGVLATMVAAGVWGAARRADAQDEPDLSHPAVVKLQTTTRGLLQLGRAWHQASPAAKRARFDALASAARARKEALLALMATQPRAVFHVALPESVRRTLPPGLEEYLEQQVELEGTVASVIIDDFDREVAETHRWLTTDAGERLRLHGGDGGPWWRTGTRVRVRGVRLGSDLVLEEGPDGSIEAAGGTASSTTTTSGTLTLSTSVQKVAVLLFNFRNNAVQPWTPAAVQGAVFTNTASAKAYHRETSFGQLLMEGQLSPDGDVFGWYTIPYDNTSCSSNYSTWAAAARSAATADGVDLAGYTKYLYLFPGTSGCPGGGWAYVGGSEAWVQGSISTYIVAHELGHTFGAKHASSFSCVDAAGLRVTLSAKCTTNAYGDPFDVMGNTPRQMNNFHKGQTGWLAPANTQTIAANGQYRLAPIEQATTGVQTLVIPRTTSESYYLEFRQPFGLFDTFGATSAVASGVSLRLGPISYDILMPSRLLDATPATTSFGDAALPVGGTFLDPVTGLRVTTVSIDSSGATVEVAFGQAACVRAVPGLSIVPVSQWGGPGQAMPYDFTVRNNDSTACPGSTFTITPTLPTGWVQSPTSWSESLLPGGSVTRSVTVTPPALAPEGVYPITQTATNGGAPQYAASATASYNVVTGDTASPVVTITEPANGATLPPGWARVSATAADASGISLIEFFVDSRLYKACSGTSACSLRFWSNRLSVGTHTLTVRATDNDPTPHTGQAAVTVIKP
ncbi:MAG: hypothetical protein HY597_01230 [Candidatus Omnitrophica bacterium]|nr:hypothetical protein [Candidatus Omnitrophota bacterium]